MSDRSVLRYTTNGRYMLRLSQYDVDLCVKNAEDILRYLSGSNVYDEPIDIARRRDDEFIGQVGTLGLSYIMTGSRDLYVLTRKEKMKKPYEGDNGSDLLGYQDDVKTSRMRAGKDYKYHLYVRDREYHLGTTYHLALMDCGSDDEIMFVGWIKAEDMPPPIKGRREVQMDELEEY